MNIKYWTALSFLSQVIIGSNCPIEPWLHIFKTIHVLNDHLVIPQQPACAQDPGFAGRDDSEQNGQIVLNAFVTANPPMEAKLSILLKRSFRDRTVLFESSNLPEDTIGYQAHAARIIPSQVYIEHTTADTRLNLGGRLFNLSGTIQGKDGVQWAHYLGVDGWLSSRDGESVTYPISVETQFLVYSNSEGPWFTILNSLQSVNDARQSQPLKQVQSVLGLHLGIGMQLTFLIGINPELQFLVGGTQPVTVGSSIHDIMRAYRRLPEILLVSTASPRNFPVKVMADKCMQLKGTIQVTSDRSWAALTPV